MAPKWIAHTDAGDPGADGRAYVAVHGHDMNGTKFFTWGQSGPGRFMQGGREPSINDVCTEGEEGAKFNASFKDKK